MAIIDNRFLQLVIDVNYDEEANTGNFSILLGDQILYSSGQLVALSENTIQQQALDHITTRFIELLG